MKQVDPRFCSPRRPIVVCGLIIRRLRNRRSAIASLLFGIHGLNGTHIPKDLNIHFPWSDKHFKLLQNYKIFELFPTLTLTKTVQMHKFKTMYISDHDSILLIIYI